jgi:hypothetical protein
MQDDRDEYEPIIATRPSRRPERVDTPPLWRLVLVLMGGVVVVALLGWWFIGKSSNDSASNEGAAATAQTESSQPEIHVEQQWEPPATDSPASPEVTQAPAPSAGPSEPEASTEQEAIPESVPGVAPDEGTQASSPPAASDDASQDSSPPVTPDDASQASSTPPAQDDASQASSTPATTDDASQASSRAPAPDNASPATVPLSLTSPDAQVRFEVRGRVESSPPLTGKAGDVIDVVPGTYRVIASGPRLETLERELTLSGEGPAEYSVELCAQPEQEHGSVAGEIVERRTCTTTPECESMFSILSEYAEQLVKDREFRTQQCAKWRDSAAPDGKWTLDTNCDGEPSATTCRIEISAGACTVTGPRRTLRGEACPRAELH